MKLIIAFFRLIRWPNLVFIALTQYLFYYCIIIPSFPETYYSLPHSLSLRILNLIVIASVCIAAGGYIINDYFDINIDQVNKPQKMIIEKYIKRRWAIVLHLVLTTIGVAISFYVSIKTNKFIFLLNVICTLLLVLYSTTFKKKLLTGNIIIAALTAWTILILYFAVNNTYFLMGGRFAEIKIPLLRIYKFVVMYAGFAFIISLIREIIKDMEDVTGDEKYNCKTMPILWGINAAKIFAGVWMVVLIAGLIVLQFYLLQLKWWLSAAYCALLIILPLIMLLKRLVNAQSQQAFHQLSNQVKWVMLAGILFMIFIKYYYV